MAKGTASLDNHPTYFEMISEAISALKERTGSSQPAIAKFIEDKYKNVLPPNFKKILSVQLKKLAKSEKLVKIKNSFKIPSPGKVKLKVKETQKKKGTAKAAKKKTEVFKKATKKKRLSQVKTPDVLKKKKNLTPMKRKNNFKSGNSSKPAKKAKK